MDWYIGCSGFHYSDWRGKFYPTELPQNKWFDYYCQHFKTLELNVTFYRFPQLSFLKNWYDKSPDDFKFAVKVPRTITHYKKFNDVKELITSFYDVINTGLQEKLGCVLFQMPPSYSYTPERLDQIINSLDPYFDNVLEFRNVSWWNEEVYQALSAKRITFCGISHPKLPADVIVNTSIIYYRFHGVPDLYRSPYDILSLQKVIDDVMNNKTGKQVFIYFNNDIGAVGVTNAKQMQQLTAK